MTRRISIPAAVFVLLFSWSPYAHAVCTNGFDYDTFTTCTSDTTTTAPPPPTSTPGNGGIFTCSAPGATSIASSAAIGGTFVPVFDAAVALNTATLTYKECTLKVLAVQDRLARNAVYVDNQFKLISEGRNGNPYWVVNYEREERKVDDQSVVDTYRSPVYSTINPAFKNDVERTVLRNYQLTTRAPQNAFVCPYQGDLKAATTNPTQNFDFGYLFALASNPGACDGVFAYYQAEAIRDTNRAAAKNEWVTRLNWGNGIYDSRNANGDVIVPGIFLNAIGQQTVTSGFRQLENVDDIGQMVGSFLSGLGSKLLSGPSSIASVQQYLGQAVQQQQGSLVNSVVGTGLTNLYQILTWEQQYNDAQQDMAATLNTAITQLRSAETKCYQLIEQNVCSSASTATSGGRTCTAESGGATLTITASTTFSNAVIVDANIKDLATALAQRITVSNENLTTINTLITNIQSTDATTRNTALQQLEAIAQSSVLHTQANVTRAQDELTLLKDTFDDTSSGIVSTAIHRWAGDDTSGGTGTIDWSGSMSSDAGWCNVNSQPTLDNWTTKWSD